MKKAIIINDTSLEYHIGSMTVIDNIWELCRRNNISIISTFTRKEIEDWIPRINKRLPCADFIIINGEGSLHDSPKFFAVLINKLEEYKDKQVVLINALWQNMKYPSMSQFLDHLSLISVRESLSYEELIKIYNKPDKITIVPDLIFYSKFHPQNTGYGDSVLSDVREKLQHHVNYFPMNSIKNTADIYAYVQWLKSLELYITGRFHGICISALANIPFFAIESNSHKISGILKDMHCEELLIKNCEEVENKKELAVNALPKIKQYAEDATHKIDQLFKIIGEL